MSTRDRIVVAVVVLFVIAAGASIGAAAVARGEVAALNAAVAWCALGALAALIA